jgi:hypothetical protein
LKDPARVFESPSFTEIIMYNKQMQHFAPNEVGVEFKPPWFIADDIRGKEEARKSVLRSIRLYRMWLTGALFKPGAPRIEETCLNRKVSNFWIAVCLARHLSEPIETLEIAHTKCALLIKTEIISRNWKGQKGYSSDATWIERAESIESIIPSAPLETILEILVDAAYCPDNYTPEMTDECFINFISQVPHDDLRKLVDRLSSGPRAFRISRYPHVYSFLSHLPPVPRYCLRERAMSAAAYLPMSSLQDRFAHIFFYPITLWGKQ